MQRTLSIPIVALALVLLPLVGCATADSQRLSAQDYSQPRETIQVAQQLGADEIPKAKLYLTYAKDGVQTAEAYLKKGDQAQAKLALARAQADANLALTLAKERRMYRQVRDIEMRIQQIRRGMEQ